MAPQNNVEVPLAGKRKRPPALDTTGSMMQPPQPPSSSQMETIPHTSSQGQNSNARPDLPHFMGYDNQLYRCICGTTVEPEEGTSIQCEGCLAWQHAGCFGLSESDLEGESYFCQLCSDKKSHKPDQQYIQYIQRFAVERQAFLQAQQQASNAAYEAPPPVREGKRVKVSGSGRNKDRTQANATVTKDAANTDGQRRVSVEKADDHAPPAPAKQRRKAPSQPRHTKPARPSPQERESYSEDVNDEKVEAHQAQGVSQTSNSDPLRLLDYTPINKNVLCAPSIRSTLQKFRSCHAEDAVSENRYESNSPTLTIEGGRSSLILGPPLPPRQMWKRRQPHDNLEVLTSVRKAPENVSTKLASWLSGTSVPSEPTCLSVEAFSVNAAQTLKAGSLIGEFRGEVHTAKTYEENPINQYFTLGLPKLFTRRLGPPLNLVLDARRYGTDMRFIRSGCHPNATLRPIIEAGHNDAVGDAVKFAVFATSDIEAGQEVVLAWEWDDDHLIHALTDIQVGNISTETFNNRLLLVGRHFAQAFGGCACETTSDCIVTKLYRMVLRATSPEFEDPTSDNGPSDYGPLVRAVRSWRDDLATIIQPDLGYMRSHSYIEDHLCYDIEESSDSDYVRSEDRSRASSELSTASSSFSEQSSKHDDWPGQASSTSPPISPITPPTMDQDHASLSVAPVSKPKEPNLPRQSDGYDNDPEEDADTDDDDDGRGSVSGTSTLTEPLSPQSRHSRAMSIDNHHGHDKHETLLAPPPSSPPTADMVPVKVRPPSQTTRADSLPANQDVEMSAPVVERDMAKVLTPPPNEPVTLEQPVDQKLELQVESAPAASLDQPGEAHTDKPTETVQAETPQVQALDEQESKRKMRIDLTKFMQDGPQEPVTSDAEAPSGSAAPLSSVTQPAESNVASTVQESTEQTPKPPSGPWWQSTSLSAMDSTETESPWSTTTPNHSNTAVTARDGASLPEQPAKAAITSTSPSVSTYGPKAEASNQVVAKLVSFNLALDSKYACPSY